MTGTPSLFSKASSSRRWPRLSKGMSSVSTLSKAGNGMRGSSSKTRALKRQSTGSLVKEVVNEVLNFDEAVFSGNCTSENFSQNLPAKEENSCKANEVNIVPQDIPKECMSIDSVDTPNDKVSSEDVPLSNDDSSVESKNLRPSRDSQDTEKSINDFKDRNNLIIIKKSRITGSDESDSQLKQLKNSEIESEESFPSIEGATEITEISNQESINTLIDLCRGKVKIDRKVVIAEFRSIKFLEDIKNVHEVLTTIAGFNPKEFHGLQAHKRKETYTFLVFEDVLLRYLHEPYETDAFGIRAWGSGEIDKNQSLITMVCTNVLNMDRSNNNIRRVAKSLLDSLLNSGHNDEEHKYALTASCALMPAKDCKIADYTVQKSFAKSTQKDKTDQKTSVNKNFHYKKKILINPHMPMDNQDKKEQFFKFCQSFFSKDGENKLAHIASNPKRPATKAKSLEALAKRCAGVKQEPKKCVLLQVVTKATLDSYYDMKTALIGLFGFKPNEFSGLTKNKDGSFAFLAEEQAFKRFLDENPNPKVGNIYQWSSQEVSKRMPTVAILCEKVTENSSNKDLKIAAKELFAFINGDNSIDLFKFLSSLGDCNLQVANL